jgi:hypothetical protein
MEEMENEKIAFNPQTLKERKKTGNKVHYAWRERTP